MAKHLFSVADKVALVTGGGQGIGRMIAQGLVDAGAKTYISSRKANVISQAAEEMSKDGGTCLALEADLSTEEGCARLADELKSREDQLHILVNNAGNTWGAPLEEYTDAAFDRCYSLNIKGVFHTTVKLLPLLRKAATPQDPARVINIGSVDGIQAPIVDNYAYSATKAGVHHMTRVLARRLASELITVNAVAPGPFDTKMMHETLERFGDEMKRLCPLGRIGEPEDMAGVVIYLSSRAGAYLTGALIPVDGGISTGHG